ncbi:hypothetical protein MNBD_CHLOROFLEXI01-280 [hydrothermal vent metagenome]|uniref:O-antigen ligase-related domain-containing protein n=1 Tax=hydrothermal vent metagenome TaxID=652676 RepID=A0A3B0VMZ0_9ZZZZ
MILRRVSQWLFGLLLFLLLASHASADGGMFTWLPLPLPTAVSGLGWQIGLLSLLPVSISLLWLFSWIKQEHPQMTQMKKESNYADSRSLSLSKAEAGGANRFGFDRLSRRYAQNLREVLDKARSLEETSRRFNFGETAVTLPLAIFSLFILTQISTDMFHYVAMLALVWFIYLFLVNNPQWQQKQLWIILALVLLLQGGVGVAQFITQQELGLTFLGEPTLDLLVEGTSVAQRGEQNWLRAYGLNSHPNQLGLLLMALCLLIWPSRHLAHGWRSWLFWLGLAAGVAGLLVSLSRSAWLGLALGGMVYGLHRAASGRLPRRELALPLALLAAGVLLFTLAYGDVLAGRLLALDSPLESRSLWERQRDGGLALQLIEKRPFQGVGLGKFVASAAKIDASAAIVHNIPLLIGAELGLLGLTLWLLFWGWPLWRYGRSPAHQSGTAVWLSLILVALVQPEPTLFLPKGAVLWGLAAAQWQNHQPHQSEGVQINQRFRRLKKLPLFLCSSLWLLSESLCPKFPKRSQL